jgi:hypothetical protein
MPPLALIDGTIPKGEFSNSVLAILKELALIGLGRRPHKSTAAMKHGLAEGPFIGFTFPFENALSTHEIILPLALVFIGICSEPTIPMFSSAGQSPLVTGALGLFERHLPI